MNTEGHAERFSRAADRYYTDRLPGRSQCIQKVLELLNPQLDDVILDIGCGPGIQLIQLAESIRAGIGVDPAEAMIQRARSDAVNCQNLSFVKGSAEKLPEEICQTGVNKIYSNYVIHHLPNTHKREAIRGLANLLPTGGLFILGDMMFSDDPEKHKDLFDYVGYVPENDSPAYVSELKEMFSESNLIPKIHVLNPLVAVILGQKI
ncbi:MAG: class I SAM-dependent methyltransferase [Verrucomicrobia bacterium]|nr:class I SAM-dependent methyltransferase [Verrucomicrobiota bacterium]